jgi:hypothetical protein
MKKAPMIFILLVAEVVTLMFLLYEQRHSGRGKIYNTKQYPESFIL